MRRLTAIVTGVLVTSSILVACGEGGKLQHGMLDTASGPVFWVAIQGKVQFMVAIDQPVSLTKNENWEGSEFNVYYDIKQATGRTPIMVYGDVNEGIITAAYDNEPLDLDQGMFFSARGSQVTVLSPSEKSEYLAQIDP